MSPAVIAVFGSSLTEPGSPQWADGVAVGERIGKAGFAVVTGGYGGTMEAVSQGASRAGAHVIGVTAPSLFPGRSGANQYVTELHEADTLSGRVDLMMRMAEGALALPGSIGTATELITCWNLNHIARRNGGTPVPCAAVGPAWGEIGRILVDRIGAASGDIYWATTGADGLGWILGRLEDRAGKT